MLNILILIVLVSVPFVGIWIVRRYAQNQPDKIIQELIDRNRYSFRDGMRTPNWTRLDAIGQERWDETVRAQERLQQ